MITATPLSCLLVLILVSPVFGQEPSGSPDPRPGNLQVSVVSSAGDPVPGTEVQLTPLTSPSGEKFSFIESFKREQQADPVSDSLFARKVDPGSYRVRVQAEGWRISEVEGVVVGAGEVRKLEVVLEPGYAITGRVIDEEGKPLARARVRSSSSGFPSTRTESSPDGHFRLTSLARGVHRVSASFPGYADTSVRNVPTGMEGLTLALKREAVIRVELKGDIEGLGSSARLELKHTRRQSGGSSSYIKYVDMNVRPGAENIFQFDGLDQGVYALRLNSEDYLSDWLMQVQALPPEKAAPVPVTVYKGAVISGRVLEAGTGRPLEGVIFSLLPAGIISGSPATDSEGKYRLSPLPPGGYTLRGRLGTDATERVRFERDIALAAGQEISGLDFEISAGREVRFRGTVVDEAGDPVAGARLEFFLRRSPRGSFRHSPAKIVDTDDSGRFSFSGNFDGSAEFLLVAEKEGRVSGRSQSIHLSDGQDELEGLIVRMPAGAVLRVEVVDGTGGAVPGAAVELREDWKPGWDVVASNANLESRQLTDPNGNWDSGELPPGHYRVKATKQGYIPAEKKTELGWGKSTGSVKLELLPGRELSVYVRDESGEPVAGAQVLAKWRIGSIFRGYSSHTVSYSDSAGLCVIDGLPGQAISLTVRVEGYAALDKVQVGADQEKVEVELSRGGRITGRLTGPDGAGVRDIRIGAYRRRGKGSGMYSIPQAVNLGDGRFAFYDLATGVYDLKINIPGFAGREIPDVEVQSGRETDIGELALEPGSVVSGRVIDGGTGLPVSSARVKLHSPRYKSVDYDGRFEYTGIPEGVYTLEVKAVGWEDKAVPGIRVSAGARNEISAVELIPAEPGDDAGSSAR